MPSSATRGATPTATRSRRPRAPSTRRPPRRAPPPPPAEPLAAPPVGEPRWVARIDDDDPALLRWLADTGLAVDAQVVVRERRPFGGATLLDVTPPTPPTSPPPP